MVIPVPIELTLEPSSMVTPRLRAYAPISSNIAPQLPWRYDACGGMANTRASRSAMKAADSEPGSGWKTPTPDAEAPMSAASSPTSFDAQSRND